MAEIEAGLPAESGGTGVKGQLVDEREDVRELE